MDFLLSFLNSMPGALGQGLIWGVMAIGVYITYRILDVADLTVDGSLATGGAMCALGITLGWNPWVALAAAILAGMLAAFAYDPDRELVQLACGVAGLAVGFALSSLYFHFTKRKYTPTIDRKLEE